MEGEKLDLAKAARLRLALTAEGGELFDLLQDTDPDVLKALLKNSNLNEEHLLALLKRRALGEQILKSVLKSPHIAGSRRLMLALAAHPGTPAHALATILPQLFLFELVTLMQLPGIGEDAGGPAPTSGSRCCATGRRHRSGLPSFFPPYAPPTSGPSPAQRTSPGSNSPQCVMSLPSVAEI